MRFKQIIESVNDLGRLELNQVGLNNAENEASKEVKTNCMQAFF